MTKSLLLYLVLFLTESSATDPKFRQYNPPEYDFSYHQDEQIAQGSYDFIIVGSGSAGSVIANRLSEVKKWRILLLEAGTNETSFSAIPLAAPLMQFTKYNWNYEMEPDGKTCLGMVETKCIWPRGKAVGGTSVINYMIYTRGNPTDYNRWASLGNPGWSYEDVLPYFIKSENAQNITGIDPQFHGKSGELSVTSVYQSPLSRAFLQAGEELGYKQIDYNSPEQIGFSHMQATVKFGRRHSVGKAFIDPIRARANLHIITSAHVTKILIDPNTKQAYAVEYAKNRKNYTVNASKEIILSAGAFNSPQLLMLSGVGPKQHLEKLQIPVVKDLPVGETLYDHVSYLGLSFLRNGTIPFSSLAMNPFNFLDWYSKGEGPYTSLGGLQALALVKSKLSKEKENYPDLEIIFAGLGGAESDYGLINRQSYGFSNETYTEMFQPLEDKSTWVAFPTVLHPKSRGRLELRSRNPFDYPLLYGNYFSSEDDLDTMVEGIKFTIKLSETKAFRAFNSTMSDIPVPNCKHHVINSDEYWKCAVRNLATTIHHQTTTCKMGPDSDPEAIVDNELKVRGIGGLRVADTSVIPFALSSHTNAPSIMIGEKASDLIKQHWTSNYANFL